MSVTYDKRGEDTGGGVQRIDGGIDTQIGDLTAQYGGRIQVGEGRSRRRISQVIRGHIYGLYGSDGTILGRGDPLLHQAHFRCQGRLVTYGRGHTAQERRDFRPGLGETEDVVYEEQDIASLAFSVTVAIIFGYGQTAEGHAGAGAGRLVHLAEHEGGFGFG